MCVASRRSTLDRRVLYTRLLRELGVRLYAGGSLLEATGAAVKTCRPECMVYLAGVLQGGGRAWEAHVELWSKVLREYGPLADHIVYYSAAVVSPCKPITSLDDAHPAMVEASDGYTLSKREGELVALKAAEEGISVSILRPVFVYGPYALHPEHRIFAWLLRLRLRLNLPVDAVPVADAARVTLWVCSRKPKGRWFYLARPEGHTIGDLFEMLCSGGRCLSVGWLAGVAARTAARFSPRLEMVARWLRCGWRFRPWGLEGFTGWAPLEEAVEEYRAWLSRL